MRPTSRPISSVCPSPSKSPTSTRFISLAGTRKCAVNPEPSSTQIVIASTSSTNRSKCRRAARSAGTVEQAIRPLGGGRALGVIECDDRALLLGQVAGRLVLVLVQGAAHVLICTAGVRDLGVVAVDAHMENLPPRRPARGAPPAQVRQHHERITQGRELGQETSDAICMALQRLGLRVALAMDPARFGLRHRGKRAVMAFIDLLVTLGLLHCGDLCGRVSDIIKQIGRHIPDLEISAAKLGEVLKLLHATGTCLIEKPASGRGGSASRSSTT